MDQSRRHVLQALLATGGATVTGSCAINGGTKRPPTSVRLKPAPMRAGLIAEDNAIVTPVWAYNGRVPGETIRVAQGAQLTAQLENGLPQSTTIHWHGLKVPNAMDGVPGLTQAPVASGEQFNYGFNCELAGTYWYHPHLGTPEQVGRGLYGALIVEEREPVAVDRELLWVIDDWRLNQQGQIVEDFYSLRDMSHAGRIGNTVTVNGRTAHVESVRHGERIRLRIINAANARIFALQFDKHPAWIVATDGHPVEVPLLVPDGTTVRIGPGQRIDLVMDMVGGPGEQFRIVDGFLERRRYEFARLAYKSGTRVDGNSPVAARPSPAALPAHGLPEPTKTDRQAIAITMDGGMMSRALRDKGISKPALGQHPALWFLNGKSHLHHGKHEDVAFVAQRGSTIELRFTNESAWWHPMHLHGHVFRELTRAGKFVPGSPWRDTTLVAPRQSVTVAFVADNPGDWLIHCHVLEHHASGMGMQFRVTA